MKKNTKQLDEIFTPYPSRFSWIVKNKRTIFFIAFILLLASLVFFVLSLRMKAAFTPVLNYQGKLMSVATGSTVTDGTYNMRFKIYNALSSGDLLWTETRCQNSGTQASPSCGATGSDQRVQVTNGLFAVLLGELNGISALDFKNDIWLEVDIGGVGDTPGWETLAPRKRLSPVVSAMSLNGYTWEVPGQIGLTTPNTGKFTTTNVVGFGSAVAGTGTVTTSTTTVTCATTCAFMNQLYTGDKVTISGQTRIVASAPANNTSFAITATFSPEITEATAFTYQKASFTVADSAGTAKFTVDQSGNIGIGTTSPSSLLELSAVDPEIRLTDTGNSEYTRLTKSDTDNLAAQYNRVKVPSTGAQGALSAHVATLGTAGGTLSDFNFGTGEYTHEFWLNVTTAGDAYFFAQYGTMGVYEIRVSYGRILVGINDNHAYGCSAAAFSSPGWHLVHIEHLADGTLNYYIDTSATGQSPGSLNVNMVGTSSLYVGGSYPGWGGPYGITSGMIDEWRTYNKILTPEEKIAHYGGTPPGAGAGNYGVPETGLIAGYHFDDAGTTGIDYSGYGHNLSIANGTWGTGVVVDASGSIGETTVWKSQDGVLGGEKGIQTFGDGEGRTVLDGATIRFNIDSAEKATITASGNLGIGTTAPTNIISLGNTQAQKFWIENSATDVVGRSLTVSAGGTIAGTSTDNVVGGNLILQSGLGTGTGTSTISFQTATTGTTGKALQTMSTKMTVLGNGNVGIGTASPEALLHLSGVDPEIRLTDSVNSSYTRLTKSDTNSQAARYNKVAVPAEGGGIIDSYTKLLLHMDGNEGGSVFTDSSPSAHTITANNVTTSQTLPKLGNASGLFPGGSGYLTIPNSADFDFGAGDMTIDFWFKNIGNGGQYPTIIARGPSQAIMPFVILAEGGAEGTLNLYMGINWAPISLGTYNATWNHYAWVRASGVHKTYKNGELISTYNNATAFADATTDVSLGLWGSSYLNGRIDELRVSKGIARWTAPFTPDTRYYGSSDPVIAEAMVWKSEDGVLIGEKGIQTFGDGEGRTVLDGATIRFNIDGVEKMQMDASGHLGIGTTAPLRALDINEASGNTLRLIYDDSDGSATNYVDYLVSSGGAASIVPSAGVLNVTGDVRPTTDNTYYLGKNDDDTPQAWKGVILKDTTDGKYYRIEMVSGVITATDLTD